MKKLAAILVVLVATAGLVAVTGGANEAASQKADAGSYCDMPCEDGNKDKDGCEQKIAGDEASQMGKGSCDRDKDSDCDKEKKSGCDKDKNKDGSCDKASSSNASEHLCGSTCDPDGDKGKDGKK